eukprot:Gregarina_sp_Poly_1__91@NODE_101_length_14427_cov_132_160237_g88_i0_p5_GENE_NODE_101_length_14427_cov_132_160237_g88_i0NODE_101_length_14427_cov_132_160237_g88_i0_p5_ORF_typecomplete_len382_score51_47MRPS33/PF08293_11/0_0059_NODE_101_length_14427_cov_132_160237_g88_i01431288
MFSLRFSAAPATQSSLLPALLLVCRYQAVSQPVEERVLNGAFPQRHLAPMPLEEGLMADPGIDWDLEPRPVDFIRGRHRHGNIDPTIRGAFVRHLVAKGVSLGTAETVGMALGEDEISNLPPQMVQHLVSSLLTVEMSFKKAQANLAMVDAGVQFLVSTVLPAEQLKVQVATQATLAPLGVLYGNDAVVKRIAHALVIYYHRKLADPYPWTYQVDELEKMVFHPDGSIKSIPKELDDGTARIFEYAPNKQRQRESAKYLRLFTRGEYNEERLRGYLSSKSVQEANATATVLNTLMSKALNSPMFSLTLDDEDDDDGSATQRRGTQLKQLFLFVRRGDELLNVIGDMLDYVGANEPAIIEALWSKWSNWLQVTGPILDAILT